VWQVVVNYGDCPAGSTYNKFTTKIQAFDGMCTCNKGTYAPPRHTRGGGPGSLPNTLKCLTQCPEKSTPELDAEFKHYGIETIVCKE
jgi:hypothetical protein